MPIKLRPFDDRVLQTIRKTIAEEHVAPSIRELADKIQINSSSLIHDSLDRLETYEYIGRVPKRARALWLTDKGKAYGS